MGGGVLGGTLHLRFLLWDLVGVVSAGPAWCGEARMARGGGKATCEVAADGEAAATVGLGQVVA